MRKSNPSMKWYEQSNLINEAEEETEEENSGNNNETNCQCT